MDDEDRQAAFLTALSTERFALQSAAGTTVAEAGARASLYMLALSSFLVATGFVAGTDAFAPFVATALPGVLALGLFTIVRLVDTAAEHMKIQTCIARIRRYYRGLTPEAEVFFAPWASGDDDLEESIGLAGATRGPFIELFTMASMVITVNGLVAGAGAGLLGVALLGRDDALIAVLVGVGSGVVAMAVFFVYQRRRLARHGDEARALGQRPRGGDGARASELSST
jgi:hypothetical protein